MKSTSIAIVVAAVLIGGAILFANSSAVNNSAQTVNANNVSVVDGKQIIEINAKGGYQPRVSVAKAGIPTILRFNTSGTFDCSSSIRIPSLGITKVLPQSGSTDISIGTQQISTLQVTCGMGMYPFEID